MEGDGITRPKPGEMWDSFMERRRRVGVREPYLYAIVMGHDDGAEEIVCSHAQIIMIAPDDRFPQYSNRIEIWDDGREDMMASTDDLRSAQAALREAWPDVERAIDWRD